LAVAACQNFSIGQYTHKPNPNVSTLYGQILIYNINVLGATDTVGRAENIMQQYTDMQTLWNGSCDILPQSIIDAPADPTFDIQGLYFFSTEFPAVEYDMYFAPNAPLPQEVFTLTQASGPRYYRDHSPNRLIEVFVVDRIFNNPRGSPVNLTFEAGGLSIGPPAPGEPDDPNIFLAEQVMRRPDFPLNGQYATYAYVFAHEMGHELNNLPHLHANLYNVMNDTGAVYQANVTAGQCAQARNDSVHLAATP
jgi:hypothetical protein